MHAGCNRSSSLRRPGAAACSGPVQQEQRRRCMQCRASQLFRTKRAAAQHVNGRASAAQRQIDNIPSSHQGVTSSTNQRTRVERVAGQLHRLSILEHRLAGLGALQQVRNEPDWVLGMACIQHGLTPFTTGSPILVRCKQQATRSAAVEGMGQTWSRPVLSSCRAVQCTGAQWTRIASRCSTAATNMQHGPWHCGHV